MLLGEYIVNLGEKNRLAIPKKIRIAFDNTIYITRGFEKSLLLTDEKRWKVLVNYIDKKSLFNQNALNTKRFFLSGAQEIDYDKQGRFVLQEALKDYIELTDKAVFIGVKNWVEIWSQEHWENKFKSIQSNLTNITSLLSDE